MIKKFEISLNGIGKEWYVTNEEQEKQALKEIDKMVSELGIDNTLQSTEDFPALNSKFAEMFDDPISMDYFVEEFNKWDVMAEIAEMWGIHEFSDNAITECLKSLGWIA